MILSLRDILVVSDMDGTLLSEDMQLPAANLETIKLFCQLGGRFTVATGRVAESVEKYTALVPYLAPGIVYNGCVLYDFAEKRVLYSESLPGTVAYKAVSNVLERFPRVGIMIFAGDGKTYMCNTSLEADTLFWDEKISCFARPLEEIPSGWNKVVFSGPAEELAAIHAFIGTQNYTGIEQVMSSPTYLELLPQGVDKGSALVKLCELQNIPLENTFAIGDYYNDAALLKTAGHAVAMQNAPGEIRMLAEETTGRSEDGGVGQFLYKLIRLYS